jgi:hypothetical protein
VVGVLLLLGGLILLTSKPLSGLFLALCGLALILATLFPGLVTRRVPALSYVPGGASVALGLVAFLALVGAVATGSTPTPNARATATVVAQGPPNVVSTTLPVQVPATAKPVAPTVAPTTAPAVARAPAPTSPPATVRPTATSVPPTAAPDRSFFLAQIDAAWAKPDWPAVEKAAQAGLILQRHFGRSSQMANDRLPA